MIFLLITTFVIFTILKDYKKGFVLFGTFFFFLKYVPSGLSNLSLFFIAIIFLFITFKFKKIEVCKDPIPKPIYYSSILMSVCCLLTEIISGFNNYLGWFNLIVCSFLFPWLMWKTISSSKDLKRFIKALIISFLIIEIYGIFQEFTNINPIFKILNPSASEINDIRYGLVRINSFLVFSSTLGTFSACCFYLFWQLYYRSNIFITRECLPNCRLITYKLLIFLALFGIVCSATRSCYLLFFIIISFIIIDKLDTNPYKRFILYFSFILIFIIIYLIGFSDLFNPLLDTINNSADGSNTDMRQNQLEICLYWMKDSPIWGNGRNYIFKVVALNDEQIYGAESLWFRLLVDYGIVGCITYIIWIISIIIVLWKYNRYYIAIPIAIFIGKTTSILMDVDYEYFLWMTVIIIKCHKYLFYKNMPYQRI